MIKPGSRRITIGHSAMIEAGAMLLCRGGDIVIGDRFSINPYSILYGHGGLRIGDDVRIASHVVVVPSSHQTRPGQTIYSQKSTMLGVDIGDDVWIGTGVVVVDGTRIAGGCVIGAGAVVRGGTEPLGIYGGVPAKLIKHRA